MGNKTCEANGEMWQGKIEKEVKIPESPTTVPLVRTVGVNGAAKQVGSQNGGPVQRYCPTW